jgi:HD superfamily phosphodiesterase
MIWRHARRSDINYRKLVHKPVIKRTKKERMINEEIKRFMDTAFTPSR